MEVQVISKRVVDLTHEEYLLCMRSNMQSRGRMQSTTVAIRNGDEHRIGIEKGSRAFLLYSGDKFIGWSLFMPSRWVRRHTHVGYFYIRREYRRMGCGTILHQEMLRHLKTGQTLCYVPWDNRSEEFFTSKKIIKSKRITTC